MLKQIIQESQYYKKIQKDLTDSRKNSIYYTSDETNLSANINELCADHIVKNTRDFINCMSRYNLHVLKENINAKLDKSL